MSGSSGGDWLAVRVRHAGRAEEVSAALFEAGAMAVQEQGDELVTQFPAGIDADGLTCAVLAASPDATVSIAPAPNVDWSEKWREGIRAHELGPITIAPPWLAEGRDPSRTVVIEPQMAFGTGEHATTRGVVRLLPRVLRPGDLVADLGAGSAVLAIAAVKLGAGRAVAVELDPDAIPNAEENVARNGVADRVAVIEGDAGAILPLLAPVRVVLANIISSVLVQLLPGIAEALTTDGQVILSGILATERDDMLAHLDREGWRVLAEDTEDAWWTVAIERR